MQLANDDAISDVDPLDKGTTGRQYSLVMQSTDDDRKQVADSSKSSLSCKHVSPTRNVTTVLAVYSILTKAETASPTKDDATYVQQNWADSKIG